MYRNIIRDITRRFIQRKINSIWLILQYEFSAEIISFVLRLLNFGMCFYGTRRLQNIYIYIYMRVSVCLCVCVSVCVCMCVCMCVWGGAWVCGWESDNKHAFSRLTVNFLNRSVCFVKHMYNDMKWFIQIAAERQISLIRKNVKFFSIHAMKAIWGVEV